MDKIKLSAIIITHNEEKDIQECIDSLKGVADEILVVDSFSADKTEEICKNSGVRFLQHEWEGYGKQKNWGNQQAAHDYILSLDADERLSDELKEAILNIKKNWQYDVYSVNRLTYFLGRKLKYCLYPNRQIRLFDRRETRWNDNKVHEKIMTGNNIKTKHINKNIIHPLKRSIHEHIETLNNYSTLSAQDSFDLGKKPGIFKLIFSPLHSFIKNYFIKLGFLDGVFGFLVSINVAHYSFLKYAKLIELYKNSKRK